MYSFPRLRVASTRKGVFGDSDRRVVTLTWTSCTWPGSCGATTGMDNSSNSHRTTPGRNKPADPMKMSSRLHLFLLSYDVSENSFQGLLCKRLDIHRIYQPRPGNAPLST
jgi:hypothetical protein